MKNPFPDFTTEQTKQRIDRKWDLTGPVPVPKFEPECPQCGQIGEDLILMKSCKFFRKGVFGSDNPFRCNVKFKCFVCSCAWMHGVVVPEEMAREFELNKIIHWRKMKRLMNNE